MHQIALILCQWYTISIQWVKMAIFNLYTWKCLANSSIMRPRLLLFNPQKVNQFITIAAEYAGKLQSI